MEPETDLRYAVLAQSSDMWPWSPMPTPAHDDPINYNISTKIYPNPVYSQGSSSPSLPSNTPEPVDVSYYEASPSIPIDNMFFAESVFRHPEFEHPNVPLPTDEAAFNALLAEVVSPSTESFDDLVDWSGSSTSGGSPPLVENYLSPSPVTFPVLSADNSPSAILMSAPGGLAPATPLPPLQPSFPSTMPRNPTAPHTCPKSGCGKSFYKRCELHKHIQKHSKPHRCSQCRTFSSAELRGLQRHYWASHREWAEQNKIPRQIAKCDFPGCKYEGRLDNLSRHMKRHTKDRDKRKKRR